MTVETRRKVVASVVFLLFGLAFGLLVARLVGPPAASRELPTFEKLLRVGLVLLGVYAALLAHELGHLTAGLAQGFRFALFAAGPLWVGRRGEKVRVAFNRFPALWGGVAATLPVSSPERSARSERTVLRRRFALVVAAGPVASLVVALGAFLAKGAVAPGRLATFLGGLALGSLCFFLATAQPFGAGGGFASDGGRLLSLLSPGRRGETELALLCVLAASTAGVRPRDLPGPELELILESPPNVLLESAAITMAYRRALDAGRLEEARRLLTRGVALLPSLQEAMRGDLLAEIADRRARDGEVAAAREALAAARGPFVERHRVLRASASVALAEGRRAEATRLLSDAGEALRTPLFEATPLDADLLAQLESAARA